MSFFECQIKSWLSHIRRYQLQFSKGILIRKGDFEYEFFNKFRELLPTGANAQLVIMLVDFRKGEAGYTDATTPVPTGRFNYKAIQFTATVTINTGNETDGLLDLSFGQASDIVSGVASSESFTETSRHPVFVPSTSIAPSMMNLSDSAATLALGEEKWIAVGMEPMGCLEAFEIVRTGGAGHDERICEARIVRNSVIITGKKAGETSVTLRSLAENGPSKTIAVKVGGGAQPVGSGAALPSGRTMAPAKTDAGKPSVE